MMSTSLLGPPFSCTALILRNPGDDREMRVLCLPGECKPSLGKVAGIKVTESAIYDLIVEKGGQ